jgi:hypothetical protein
MCLGQRDTGTRGTDGSQTHRWREQDSNPRSLSEGKCWKGRTSRRGGSLTEGSNPSSSSGESGANLT